MPAEATVGSAGGARAATGATGEASARDPSHGAGITSTPEDPAPNALPAVSMLSGFDPRTLVSIVPALFVAGNAFDQALLGITAAIALLVAVGRFVHWRRFRWGFDGQVLYVNSGLLWRSRRAVDIGRIQQVELQRPLLHRAVGTALLRIETAADAGQTEVALNGLAVDVARNLREAIAVARRRAAAPGSPTTATPAPESGSPGPAGVVAPTSSVSAATVPGPAPEPPIVSVYRPSVADLVRHAVTGRALLILPVSIAALGQFVFELNLFGDDLDEVAGTAVETASSIGVVVVSLILLAIGLVAAVASTLVRDWDLELVREGDDFRLSRGLLDQRSATVPLRRLQVLEYRQNWIRALFDVGTVHLRSAGGASADQARRITVPWVARRDLVRVLELALEPLLEDESGLPLRGIRHPLRARRRLWYAWARGFGLPILVLTVVGLVLGRYGAETVLATAAGLLVLSTMASWLLSRAQYRRLGHATGDRVALVTGGVVGHASTWMPLGRLQGVVTRANPFQRRLDLVTIVLSPAGGSNAPVEIRDVTTSRAGDLGEHFLAVAAGQHGPADRTGMVGPATAVAAIPVPTTPAPATPAPAAPQPDAPPGPTASGTGGDPDDAERRAT